MFTCGPRGGGGRGPVGGGAGAGPAHPAEAGVGRGVDADPGLGPAVVKWLLGVTDDLSGE